MKKILLLILTILSLEVSAQIVTIPDANFKANLVGNTSINTNNDSEIQVFEAVAFTGTINCSGLPISDLTGIEAFTNLTILDCTSNLLTSIDLTQNTALTTLSCSLNSLSSLNLSQNTALITLRCGSNLLTSLDVTQNTALFEINCPSNSISSLDVSNNLNLGWLLCSSNSLTALNVFNNVSLTDLDITHNPLISIIDVSQNLSIVNCFIGNTGVTTLDLSQHSSLSQFSCDNTPISFLNVANGTNMANIVYFHADFTPNLNCIQVDDVAYSTANWTSIDAGTVFSTNCAALEINEVVKNIEITTYPNPTIGKVTFSTTEHINSIEILNLSGQKIATFENTNTIDISQLSKGVYTARILVGNSVAIKRIIKE